VIFKPNEFKGHLTWRSGCVSMLMSLIIYRRQMCFKKLLRGMQHILYFQYTFFKTLKVFEIIIERDVVSTF
jgi:hypothetical protein